jgi:uncharacterized membrane protein
MKSHNTPLTARRRAITAFSVGIVVGLLALWQINWQISLLLAWDTAAATFVLLTWLAIYKLDGKQTEKVALYEDPSRAATSLVMTTASVFSLVAVGLMLFKANHLDGVERFIAELLCVLSVVAAWFMVHTLFTLRYGELYYARTRGGIDFYDTTYPSYKDFAYVAFTIGMTFQVSDTALESQEIRHTALRHALLAYLFGTIFVASTINAVISLAS